MKSKNYSEKILDVFKKKGFVFSEPDVLLDSNYIIQRSGENFKKLIFTFEDDNGKNMCLRPDLTVASCVKYLKENSRGTSKIYYSGQAYRRSNNSKESIINDQVGLEIIGSKKKLSDDKEIINTILKSIDKIKIKNVSINIGDFIELNGGPAGNVMAMMPHPERTENGDVVFSSMKEFIENENPVSDHNLSFDRPHYEMTDYKANSNATEWIIDMIITDNEASSVRNALDHLGHNVSIARQTHWEISMDGDRESILKKIDATGELYNSNKEFISQPKDSEKNTSFLVRQKEDMLGRAKYESLKERFEIDGITDLKRGVIWNVTVNSGSFDAVLNDILGTHILFNPLSHECYRIN